MRPQYSATMSVMIKAVRAAARGIRRDFGELENLQVSQKGPKDFVSAADLMAEKSIIRELKKARPDYGFLTEEHGEIASESEKPATDFRWVIDPIDGTHNFIHGVPYFAISVALEERGKITHGVVYSPITDELFIAERGCGAFLNDRRLRVSGRKRLENCLIGTGRIASDPEMMKLLLIVSNSVFGLRCAGAASLDLAYVAAGRYDGFFCRSLKPWDFAAGMLMISEAGGMVTDFSQSTITTTDGAREILATNGEIHADFSQLIR